MKPQIDIEALLVWAYRDQCVDRVSGRMAAAVSGPGLADGSGFYRLGTRIDAPGAHLTALGAAVPDDALAVHDAVLALGEWFIEWMLDDEVMAWPREGLQADGATIVEAGNGPVILRGEAPARAATRVEASILVIGHARHGTRPAVFEGWTAPGRPAKGGMRRDAGGLAVAADRHQTTLSDVLWHRAVYHVWWSVLDVLAGQLSDRLGAWRVVGPEAMESPWGCQTGRVLDGMRDEDNRMLIALK